MSIKQLIPQEIKLGHASVIPVQPGLLSQPTMGQQVILAEAKLYRLNPRRQFVGIVEAPDPSAIIVAIGEVAYPSDDLAGVWVREYNKEIFKDTPYENVLNLTGTNLRIKVCHLMLSIPGNPLDLHWRALPGVEPWIVIEGLEQVQKTKDAADYAAKLCNLLPRIGDYVKPAKGRPSDIAESQRIVAEAEAIRNRTKKLMPWWKVAQQMNMTKGNLSYHRDQVRNNRPKLNK